MRATKDRGESQSSKDKEAKWPKTLYLGKLPLTFQLHLLLATFFPRTVSQGTRFDETTGYPMSLDNFLDFLSSKRSFVAENFSLRPKIISECRTLKALLLRSVVS